MNNNHSRKVSRYGKIIVVITAFATMITALATIMLSIRANQELTTYNRSQIFSLIIETLESEDELEHCLLVSRECEFDLEDSDVSVFPQKYRRYLQLVNSHLKRVDLVGFFYTNIPQELRSIADSILANAYRILPSKSDSNQTFGVDVIGHTDIESHIKNNADSICQSISDLDVIWLNIEWEENNDDYLCGEN